jgi:hypothetical protein
VGVKVDKGITGKVNHSIDSRTSQKKQILDVWHACLMLTGY